MTTKDEALKQALEWIEAQPEPRTIGAAKVVQSLRAALAQNDEQALHAGAAVPSEAISLSGDAKLAHDQCRAVAHLANSFAEVYAARAAIVAHDAKLSDLIGDASASAMEWLGDELNAMDAATEDDGWLDPIFEAAQKRWPQQPPRRPQKDEQGPALWKWILRSDPGHFGYYTEHPSKFGIDMSSEKYEWTLFYTAPPKRKPLTDVQISHIWDRHIAPVFGKNGINPVVFARAIERAILEKSNG